MGADKKLCGFCVFSVELCVTIKSEYTKDLKEVTKATKNMNVGIPNLNLPVNGVP